MKKPGTQAGLSKLIEYRRHSNIQKLPQLP
jgi:hypothetical protein